MTIRIRHGSVAALAEQAPSPSTWMSESECARVRSTHAATRRAQFIAGRWLARVLLSEAMGGSWHDWTLTAEDDAPPRVSGPATAPAFPSATLSLSHSGDLVACALGMAPLGIDVEACTPRKGLDALYDAVTTADERRALAAHLGTDTLQCFLHAWTLKEAGLKREGDGLFATMLGHALQLEAATDPARANACTWQLDGHVLALSAEALGTCTLPGFPPPRYWKLARHTSSR